MSANNPSIPIEIQRKFGSVSQSISQLTGRTATIEDRLGKAVTTDPKSLNAIASYVQKQLQANGSSPLNLTSLPGGGGGSLVVVPSGGPLSANLGSADSGTVVLSVSNGHMWYWNGSGFQWANADLPGVIVFAATALTLPASQWSICNGSTQTFWHSNGNSASAATPTFSGFAAGSVAWIRL